MSCAINVPVKTEVAFKRKDLVIKILAIELYR
jgi:hypothetical protein